jgi:MYXO-CTERM domain-containing protein
LVITPRSQAGCSGEDLSQLHAHLDRKIGSLAETIWVKLVLFSQPFNANLRAERKCMVTAHWLHRLRTSSEAFMRTDLSRASVSLMVVVIAVLAFAAPLAAVVDPPVAVPEINGASVSAGLALLGAGALWLRARRRVK